MSMSPAASDPNAAPPPAVQLAVDAGGRGRRRAAPPGGGAPRTAADTAATRATASRVTAATRAYGQQQYGGGYEPYGDQANGYPAANGYAPPATVPPPAYQQQQRVRHLLTVDGSQQWVELHVGSNVIGRGQDADLRLPDTGVSRRHVDVRFDGVGAVLHDVGLALAPVETGD